MLIVICGATATGKSALAMELAQRLGTGIISADSRQVYRYFNIGTAKPSGEDQNLVPHYLIDICDPTENYTLAQYQEQANQVLSFIHKPALMVGGTGLYLKAIAAGLKIPPVAPQPVLRSQLATISQPELYQWLAQLDPTAATKIHPHDQTRTLRALEVYYVTGRPISEQQGESPPSYPIYQIALDCEAEALSDRITHRTDSMLQQGLVAEVQTIIDRYGKDLPLLETMGYREIKQYLQGEISLAEARDAIILRTRQFAKRQRTWFRQVPNLQWFDANQTDLVNQIWQFLAPKLEL